MVPDNRPSFKELYINTSHYIQRIAGYLELGFNPFAGVENVKSTVNEKQMEDEEKGISDTA